MNYYTKEIVADLGDFTKAGFYIEPKFTATQTVFASVEGVETDINGNVIYTSGSDTRQYDSPSSYNYYRETIPAANSVGIDFSCTSWW